MIPFKRAFDEKRRLVIPVAAGLALNVILYVGVVYPLGVRVRTAEQRDQAAAGELSIAERDDRAARAVVQGRDRTDTALQTFYHDVLPNSLASARGMTYLRLAQLAEQHHLRYSHRSAESESNPQGSLRRLRISMALEGRLRQRPAVHLSARVGAGLHRDRQRHAGPGRRRGLAAAAHAVAVDLLPTGPWSVSASGKSRWRCWRGSSSRRRLR